MYFKVESNMPILYMKKQRLRKVQECAQRHVSGTDEQIQLPNLCFLGARIFLSIKQRWLIIPSSNSHVPQAPQEDCRFSKFTSISVLRAFLTIRHSLPIHSQHFNAFKGFLLAELIPESLQSHVSINNNNINQPLAFIPYSFTAASQRLTLSHLDYSNIIKRQIRPAFPLVCR